MACLHIAIAVAVLFESLSLSRCVSKHELEPLNEVPLLEAASDCEKEQLQQHEHQKNLAQVKYAPEQLAYLGKMQLPHQQHMQAPTKQDLELQKKTFPQQPMPVMDLLVSPKKHLAPLKELPQQLEQVKDVQAPTKQPLELQKKTFPQQPMPVLKQQASLKKQTKPLKQQPKRVGVPTESPQSVLEPTQAGQQRSKRSSEDMSRSASHYHHGRYYGGGYGGHRRIGINVALPSLTLGLGNGYDYDNGYGNGNGYGYGRGYGAGF